MRGEKFCQDLNRKRRLRGTDLRLQIIKRDTKNKKSAKELKTEVYEEANLLTVAY